MPSFELREDFFTYDASFPGWVDWYLNFADYDLFCAYGGPLFAFSDSAIIDPLNTRLNGGEPRNALDGSPSSYLGTEIDLGVRAHLDIDKTILSAGIEGALLLPGAAFTNAQGDILDPLVGGRAMARYQF